MSASARHCTAAFYSFNPEFAFRALFILGTFNEFLKFFIILAIRIVYTILSACLAIVVVTPAFQTVVILAGRTAIVIKLLLPAKSSSAPRGWTPRCLSLVFLDINIKCKSFKLFSQLSINELMHISCCKLPSTSHWTIYLYFLFIN